MRPIQRWSEVHLKPPQDGRRVRWPRLESLYVCVRACVTCVRACVTWTSVFNLWISIPYCILVTFLQPCFLLVSAQRRGDQFTGGSETFFLLGPNDFLILAAVRRCRPTQVYATKVDPSRVAGPQDLQRLCRAIFGFSFFLFPPAQHKQLKRHRKHSVIGGRNLCIEELVLDFFL